MKEKLLELKKATVCSSGAFGWNVREVNDLLVERGPYAQYPSVTHVPEKELLDAVREELFAPLEGLPRYERLVDGDVKHDEECERFATTSYLTEVADELTEKEYERLRTIRDLAEDSRRRERWRFAGKGRGYRTPRMVYAQRRLPGHHDASLGKGETPMERLHAHARVRAYRARRRLVRTVLNESA